MIFVLSALPRAGKTTLAELCSSYGLARVVDISHSIHQKVFFHYKVPLTHREALKGHLKEVKSPHLDGKTFRQCCIEIGDFYGDRYQSEMVRDAYFADSSKIILVPSIKNQFTLDYLKSIVDCSVKVVGIVRPGLEAIKDTRTPLVVDFTITNDGGKKYLYNQFKRITELA